MKVWDPIGVADVPEAKSEYDSYVGRVLLMLEQRSTAGEIADHLDAVASQQMGLRPDRDRSMAAAEMLTALNDSG